MQYKIFNQIDVSNILKEPQNDFQVQEEFLDLDKS